MNPTPLRHTLHRALLLLGLASLHLRLNADVALSAGTTKIQMVKDKAAFAHELRHDSHSEQVEIRNRRHEHEGEHQGEGRGRGIPSFSSSFDFGGVNYPYTMVGYPPSSGRTATIRSVIIPIRLNYVGFDQDVTFEPGKAVDNIVRSPMFQDAKFPNGISQYGDMLQRATFWNKMDAQRRWHVRMSQPRVLKTIDVRVTPSLGRLVQLGEDPATSMLGVVSIEFMDSMIHTLIDVLDLKPDELPIFVTYNAVAQALGYHDAYPVASEDGGTILQTVIYTSWLETELLGELLADVSTINHEIAEWLNDPFINNIVPAWTFPPFNTLCADIPYLEVGDPQGNGPEYYMFPVIPVPLNGFVYHLQDVVMLPWFTGEVPSSAQNGWYDFPGKTQILSPAVLCTP